ncbi:MAG: acetyl-CoA carboxylase biotin carboxylase subunit [Candidatus Promineofilum sp.]|nr:acetyl-CoA carboxylase biotin carboxylase subunit [Promineifilum sp.]
MFHKVLIANRGEIARRIIRACHELGASAVAIYSDVDKDAPWVREADEAYALHGSTAAETYLNSEKLLTIAGNHGVEAIHPGYGFLSENADFAAACARRGLVFVGPSPEAMRALGSKAAARALAQRHDVPVVPGVDGAGRSDNELAEAAEAIGYPVLIKASAGGGGKGMRVVDDSSSLPDALRAARQEAQSAFGDPHVLLEKYFTQIHHVEVQVLGDAHGNLLHLYERECSIQRRHQKIIEESPSPVVGDDEGLREAITAAAVRLARAAGYSSAGTVEFIVDGAGGFYFLEMNTRLQVEHPVTESVTGIDLVTWQLRVATGEPLGFAQDEVTRRGHAIECRVYAEDPATGFLPSIGEIVHYGRPAGPGLRVDDGIESGSAVSPYYDPMLAKVITWGAERREAIRKMERALSEMVVLGVATNIGYLRDILAEPAFVAGQTSTSFLAEHMADWQPPAGASEDEWIAAAAFEVLSATNSETAATVTGGQPVYDPWATARGWRNVAV